MKTKSWSAFDEESWGDINETFGRNPGVYILRLKNIDLTDWQAVPRLLAKDPTGTLYVGRSDAIIVRVSSLRAGLYGAYKFRGERGRVFDNPLAHNCSRRMTRAFVERHDKNRLVIEITAHEQGSMVPVDYDPGEHETWVINKYATDFGEAPPFNSSWNMGGSVE